jgi:4-carboxymuconolactone decarboxylase
MTTLNERFQKGQEIRSKFVGGGPIGGGSVPASQEVAPDLHRIAGEALFGTIWQRPGLAIQRREMITLSALTVLQRENQLTRHVSNALNLGLTPQQVIEVMIHASWYGGVPTAFNAMGVAKGVFDGLGITFEPQLVFDPEETPDDLYRRGTARREELMGPPSGDARPGPVTEAERDFNRLSTEYYWGSVWNRPGLELADRSICTLACLTVLGREGPLRSHINGALHVGLTPEEIVEVFIHATFYGGIPFTRAAIDAANEIFRARGLG